MFHVDDWVVPHTGKYRGTAGMVTQIEAQAYGKAGSPLPDKVKVRFGAGFSVRSVVFFSTSLRPAYKHEIPKGRGS